MRALQPAAIRFVPSEAYPPRFGALLGTVLARLADLARTDAERIAYLPRGAQLYEDALSDDQTAVAIRALEGAMALEEAQGGQLVIA